MCNHLMDADGGWTADLVVMVRTVFGRMLVRPGAVADWCHDSTAIIGVLKQCAVLLWIGVNTWMHLMAPIAFEFGCYFLYTPRMIVYALFRAGFASLVPRRWLPLRCCWISLPVRLPNCGLRQFHPHCCGKSDAPVMDLLSCCGFRCALVATIPAGGNVCGGSLVVCPCWLNRFWYGVGVMQMPVAPGGGILGVPLGCWQFCFDVSWLVLLTLEMDAFFVADAISLVGVDLAADGFN
ncbi:hypothetical protein Nepgr_018712 [Nepenthes gracilis]|uniref:Uncharacterized protein n=1 Tax=Nepenthes gracilis TaxID=150966 RepID=A0AAD3SU34_NEPGR|nr:hypothetical protein Nepgr_018712 [Nepenthes gracilis]